MKTVFMECGYGYRDTGPKHLKPVGETEFVASVAAKSAATSGKAVIAGTVSHADMSLGDALLGEVLDAHEQAGNGLFRGIRHGGANHPYPDEAMIPGHFPVGIFLDESFQSGVRQLGARL